MQGVGEPGQLGVVRILVEGVPEEGGEHVRQTLTERVHEGVRTGEETRFLLIISFF